MFWNKPKAPPTLPPQAPPPLETPIRLGQGHPGTFAGPENDLERALLAFRQRQLEAARFLEFLLNSKVYILPHQKDIVSVGGAPGLAKDPHLFSLTYPKYCALAIYSSASRAKPT